MIDPFRRDLVSRASAVLLSDTALPEEALLLFADAVFDLETAEAVQGAAPRRRAEYWHCLERG